MLETKHTLHVLPIHIVNPQMDKERALYIGEELESLIDTLGGKIVDRIIQKMDKPNNATFIGKGKVQEVVEKLKNARIDVIILNSTAKPGQVHALKEIFQKVNPEIDVWDRVDLILHIFEKHATTSEAKLQIELARMRYMGPRIYGMGFVMSNQGGGIGTLGVGETNTELMKRHWRNEMKKVMDQLAKLTATRSLQLERRKRAGFRTVSIVGYTNAGKSSLFNLLSGKHTLAKNELFATLDSSVGKLYLPQLQEEVLLTDTIGFIRNLPPKLINAFKSTLMESIQADLLLHVIDVSDPEVMVKISVVTDILRDLGVSAENVVFVFNKIDAAKSFHKEELLEKFGKYSPLFVSVKSGEGIAEIQGLISKRLLRG